MTDTEIVTISITIPTLLSVLGHVIQWGRTQERIDQMERQIQETKNTEKLSDNRVTIVERDIHAIKVELLGVSGQDGLRAEIRKLENKIDMLIKGRE